LRSFRLATASQIARADEATQKESFLAPLVTIFLSCLLLVFEKAESTLTAFHDLSLFDRRSSRFSDKDLRIIDERPKAMERHVCSVE
jgi:hypothetical protein